MLFKLYPKNNAPERLQRVVDVLNDGGIIIYPTDTMYAIGCHALKERSIERICKLKGIDSRKHSLSVICYDLSNISQYARVENATFKLMKRNLPGPFTFILPGTSRLPKIFSGRKEVGIRMPQCAPLQQLIEQLEAPLMVASLPIEEGEDEGYITLPELIEERWSRQVDLIIDAGEGQTTQSTIIDCTQSQPELLRQGAGELIE